MAYLKRDLGSGASTVLTIDDRLQKQYESELIDFEKLDLETKDSISPLFHLVFDRYVNMACDAISPQVNDSTWYCFLGDRGTGKSTLSYIMAHAIIRQLKILRRPTEFSIDHVCFSTDDLVKFLRTKQNAIVVWEESGVGAYSRDFMTKSNKDLNKIFQMFRYKNIILISNFQHLNLLDKHARMQINRVFWLKSKIHRDKDGTPYTSKYLSSYFCISNPFYPPYFLPENAILANSPNYQHLVNIQIPPEAILLKRYAVPENFKKEYLAKKNDFFNKTIADSEEENEHIGKARSYKRRAIAYQNLVETLRNQSVPMTDIARLSKIDARTLYTWNQITLKE